jgi:hypothetical protein
MLKRIPALHQGQRAGNAIDEIPQQIPGNSLVKFTILTKQGDLDIIGHLPIPSSLLLGPIK